MLFRGPLGFMILEDCATYNLLQLLNVELFIYNSSHNIYVFLNNDNVPKCLGSGVCVYIYIYIFFFSNNSIITYLDSCPIILCLDLNLVECRVR